MQISGFWLTFAVGSFGGVMGEALHWYLRRESEHIETYLKRPRYWISTAAMILIGGILAVFYGVESKSAILVANIGLTAPLIIKSMAQITPPGTVPRHRQDHDAADTSRLELPDGVQPSMMSRRSDRALRTPSIRNFIAGR